MVQLVNTECYFIVYKVFLVIIKIIAKFFAAIVSISRQVEKTSDYLDKREFLE